MENSKNSNIIQLVLVAALVGAAFYIGSLSSKVGRLEKVDANSGTPSQGAEAPATFDSVALASSLGLDSKAFKTCVDNRDTKARVEEEEKGGQVAGVQGTPGIIMLDTKTGNSAIIPGAVDSNTMQLFLDNVLAGKDTTLGTQTIKLGKIEELIALSDADYVRGDKSSRVLLFEYSDYDCPFCKRVHPTLQKLLDDNAGKVAWIYRQFPLDQLHPTARSKSEAALCAGKLGGNDAFWAFSDALAKL
ncbi:MAG: Sodium/proton antiporter [candidate division WWE3 bacterium GW2011_GWF2_41_45]|uniref:Thioredoxin-like fold domain-containing protein n=2 Tax=Katanobacteria TaxID=422282 RepID=A0A1F4W3Y0_UNCKA|nr:MAG: Sodium/proton antiporter [candidate division WWE3 bacterium GW2011_GWC2_41_23]KKS09996.1 MAG: Sodium/proton antiporter [candidate division WWE3 bacterium GW2011_GWF2_41_45]KKS11956.1 MAG: Sodium/proton antiporter [candidate division WWE3 bacterium GW2011_GWF1_41_53]KKS19846.1 MAG: Sodium/proton antiporter [candidate division WWE3 bacterium GW2011_GWE1_41_72]KKS28027.1 MAG: Sodium/proton antiporter [candidate division WWE3 bacterium GW2011_GWC1_42_102]KKS28524.1 MAG: Sodium/proton antip